MRGQVREILGSVQILFRRRYGRFLPVAVSAPTVGRCEAVQHPCAHWLALKRRFSAVCTVPTMRTSAVATSADVQHAILAHETEGLALGCGDAAAAAGGAAAARLRALLAARAADRVLEAPLPGADVGVEAPTLPDVRLLGLSKGAVGRACVGGAAEAAGHRAVVQRDVLGKLEAVLQRRCDELAVLVGGPAEPPALQRHVEELVKSKAQLRDEVRALELQRDAAAERLHRQLCEHVDAAVRELQRTRLGSSVLYGKTRIQYFMTVTVTALFKLAKLQHQLQTLTYNKESVPALRKLKQLIDVRRSALRAQLADSTDALQRYQALGQPFADVCKRYGDVTAKLQDAKAFVQRLRSGAGF